MVTPALVNKVVRRLRRIVAWVRYVKLRWGGPEPVQVVIFDPTNVDYMLPLCGGARTLVLDVSSQTLHLSWLLLLDCMRLLLLGSGLRIAYLAALLRQLQPAIVVTFIDNSDLFYALARANHRRMRFLAIQNGARYDVVEMSPGAASRIFIPEFACFGEYEEDLYSGKGAQVGRFIPIGSLREAYFRRYWRQAAPAAADPYDHDLCVIAEAAPGWDRIYPGSEDAMGNVAKYAVRLAREKGLRLVIAGKRDVMPAQDRAHIHQRDTELDWYRKYIGEEVAITPRVRDQFTTYGLTVRSRLSLALMSTMLRETASRGGRVLFCNFSGDRRWDFCVDGIWSLKEDSYEAFAERVMALLDLSDEAWREKSAKMARYVMNNDDLNPTHVALEKIIAEAVAARA
jgi:hypothetical protein